MNQQQFACFLPMPMNRRFRSFLRTGLALLALGLLALPQLAKAQSADGWGSFNPSRRIPAILHWRDIQVGWQPALPWGVDIGGDTFWNLQIAGLPSRGDVTFIDKADPISQNVQPYEFRYTLSSGALKLTFQDNFSLTTQSTTSLESGGVYLSVSDSAPVLLPLRRLRTLPVGQSVVLDLLADAADAEADPLLATGLSVSPAAAGSVSLSGGRYASFTPVPGYTGHVSIGYSITDEVLPTAGIWRLDYLPASAVNHAPSFVQGADQASSLLTSQIIPGWATAITDGDAATEQALTLAITGNTNPGLFATPPSLSSDGTLRYQLAGTPGSATLRVTLVDDDSLHGTPALATTQTFVITALPPAIAPTGLTLIAEGGAAMAGNLAAASAGGIAFAQDARPATRPTASRT
jgi:hypothetical protein